MRRMNQISIPSASHFFANHDRGRDARHRTPPAQIRASGIPALGSYLGWVTEKRTAGQG